MIKIKEKELQEKKKIFKDESFHDKKAKLLKDNERILKSIVKYKSISRDIVEELVLQLSKQSKKSQRSIRETMLQHLNVLPKDIDLVISDSDDDDPDDEEED